MRWFLFVVLLAAFLVGVFGGSVPEGAADDGTLRIGLLEEPKTLNVFQASDAWSWKILGQIYQPLVIRDPETLQIIPWLTEDLPVFDPETISYTIRLRPAKWSDGSELTAADVVFTARLIQEFQIPQYASRWKFVSRVEALDPRTVRVTLEAPKAIFLTRTLETPIVSRREWERVVERARGAEKPLRALLNHRVENPIGTGPFVLTRWKEGAFLLMKTNEHFFGKNRRFNGRDLGPHLDGLLFKFYGTSDIAILALKKGAIDLFWWGIQAGYLDDLRDEEGIELFFNERSALYYMGFNLRRPPLDDPVLRRAVATLIDKEFIVQRVLQKQGVAMDAIVPQGNRFWSCPDPRTYGKGLTRHQRLERAHEMLRAAGYSWEVAPVDERGKVVYGRGIRTPDGKPMREWSILTPPADYDPLRAVTGAMIQEWLREAGIPASARPMGFSALLEKVKTSRDFDAFVLAYGSLSLDPDYLRSFFQSSNDKPRGWNMSGYHNPLYDRLANESVDTIDRRKRQSIVWEMQRILAVDLPYLPLYNPYLVEAARRDRFEGWVPMLDGIGNLWTFCELRPRRTATGPGEEERPDSAL